MIELHFNKDNTYSLRGVCMLMIILSHTASSVEPTAFGLLPQALVARFGYLGTSVFFFLSGYGLLHSMSRHKRPDFDWLQKHALKLLLPFIFTIAVYWAMLAVGLIDIDCNLLANMLTLSLPTADLWFYKVILSIYLLTFAVFLLKVNINTKISLIAAGVGGYYLFSRLSGWDGWWWNSVLNFPLGMIVTAYTIQKGAVRLGWKKFALLEIILLAVCLLFVNRDSTITAIAFTLFTVLFIHLFNLRSKILNFIGTESIFFYLIEVPAMDIRPTLMPTDNYILYSLFILLIVALLIMVYKIWEMLAIRIKEKVNKIKNINHDN